MKRAFFILSSMFFGLLLSYQITAVLSHNQDRAQVSTARATPMKTIDLGTLGGETSRSSDLNESGHVAGSSVLSSTGESRAFRWLDGTMVALNATTDSTTQANAINTAGIVAGAVISDSGGEQTVTAALWSTRGYAPLAAVDDAQSSARDINEAGIVAGHTISEANSHILIWQNGILSETIPINDGAVAHVNRLNDQRQIVGMIQGDDGDAAFLWQAGSLEYLGSLGGQHSAAYDINEAGKIVGDSSIEGNLATHAFLWQEGSMIDLGTLGDVISATSRALSINAQNSIVGEAQVGDVMHAVLWENGEIIDLNSMLPRNSEWDWLQSAVSINDKGWIAGTGVIKGKEHAFLMRPVTLDNQSYLPVVTWDKYEPPPTPTPSPTPPGTIYDLARYITGDGRLYEVHLQAADFDTQARHQTQFEEGNRFYHTKGEFNTEWEELWTDQSYIYRGTDTSPGNKQFYTLYETIADYLAGNPGSSWTKREMVIGESYFRHPYVVFRNKSDCSLVTGGYYDPSYLKFRDFHRSYTFARTGITVENVVELAWLPGHDPNRAVDEVYFYAEGFGLVGWQKLSNGWNSAISEEHHDPLPDNQREEIPCLDNIHNQPQSWSPRLHTGPLPEPYASLVRP